MVDRLGQRAAETGQVRAAIRIRDRVGEAEDLVVVAVVVLHHDIDEDLVALPRENDRLRMNDRLVLAELPHEFLDAVLVEKRLLLRRLAALVGESDLEAGIEERQFAQAVGEPLELKLGRDREDRRVRQEGDERAGLLLVLQLADDLELLRRLPALEAHVIDLAVARDLDLEPIGERVDALRADAVQTAGIFVGALPELAAGVQIRQDQLDGRHLELRMHVDRNAAAVVADRNGAIDVDGDFDLAAITGEMFVDRVVEHLENAVVQPALIRVADIHAGPLPDGFQTLQFVDLGGVVFLAFADAGAASARRLSDAGFRPELRSIETAEELPAKR